MKIKSDFVDVYDLQHSMDHDYTWVRNQTTVDVDNGFPAEVSNARALIYYIGKSYVVDEAGQVQELLGETPSFFRGILEPIALAIPMGASATKVILNPSVRQVTGIAQIDGNPYRIHQEIEAYLKVRGVLLDGNSE